MANIPSGIGSLPSGIGSFSPGGGYNGPSIKVPPGGYNLPLSVLSYAMGVGSGPASAGPAAPGGPPNGYGPLSVTAPLVQTYGIGSQFNPMTVFDLMNQGVGPFVSPFAGSGLLGYPSAPAGAGRPLAAGSALSGALAAGAPVPQSGGKGVMG